MFFLSLVSLHIYYIEGALRGEKAFKLEVTKILKIKIKQDPIKLHPKKNVTHLFLDSKWLELPLVPESKRFQSERCLLYYTADRWGDFDSYFFHYQRL